MRKLQAQGRFCRPEGRIEVLKRLKSRATGIGRLVLTQAALALLVGCGYNGIVPLSKSSSFFISLLSNSTDPVPVGQTEIDTNCTGCNSRSKWGRPVEQFIATFPNGGAAPVIWSVSGGDTIAGPGIISPDGQYTPPAYVTADRVRVVIRASLRTDSTVNENAVIWVTPGFLQPLTPENAAAGANGSVVITGYLTEVGGSTGMSYTILSPSAEESSSLGSLSDPTCRRTERAFTSCSVTYHAPSSVAGNRVVTVTAAAGSSPASLSTRILLNAAGISSNPANHQAQLTPNFQLGTSGGNNGDYDSMHGRVVDCCSGTLGALIKGTGEKQYLLSNNHVLARSDHATIGDAIVQPGLIDNNCMPSSPDSGNPPVASLTGWLPLDSKETNVDAAIGELRSSLVDLSGSILEMGARQPDGTLAAAPPGISSSNGKGEPGTLQLKVAKSGRTTGQTCGAITAIDVDVSVDYYLDCAETKHYLTKMFTHQLAISGDGFGDAGDSGSLVLDAGNAEPVGLYFAGGIDSFGVSQAMANPAPEVLTELSARAGEGIGYTFVGTQDHPVSCLNYGDSTVAAAQKQISSDAEVRRAQDAMSDGEALVNPDTGILGIAMGKSNDHPGEVALIVYTDPNSNASVPANVRGVRTVVVSSEEHPETAAPGLLGIPTIPSLIVPPSALNAAIAIKQQYAPTLMKQNPAFFAIGVGQSLDNPREAALVIYVDQRFEPGRLPQAVGGLRTRYIVMDRFHVTQSYAVAGPATRRCKSQLTEPPLASAKNAIL